jgi:uncharacterized protein
MDKETIKQILVENHEFIAKVELVKRDVFFEEAGNYVLVGSRRAGKTYCMLQIIKYMLSQGVDLSTILYFNFEDERLLELKAADLSLIADTFKELFSTTPIYFLDEIQNIDGWEKFARRLADAGSRVFITGSNAKMLSREIATTLGGRFLIKEIYPLNFQEYLAANKIALEKNWEYGSQRFEIRKHFETYFYFGGFPEILKFAEKRQWLDNLYQKIFYGDLVARYKIRNEFALKLTVKKLAENIHDEVSFNRIKNIIQSTGTKIGTSTVLEYVSFLEESWLVFGVKNYLAKISERETKKKYYFMDNGILTLFLINPATILLENIVAVKLRQLYADQFYYVKANNEVDFYIPTRKMLIQVCYTMSKIDTEKREMNALLKINELIKADYLIIITLDEQRTEIVNGFEINILPVWKWLID